MILASHEHAMFNSTTNTLSYGDSLEKMNHLQIANVSDYETAAGKYVEQKEAYRGLTKIIFPDE